MWIFMIVHSKMFHDIIISRKTHYLEIIHNIHNCKIYGSGMTSAIYPQVYYIEPVVWSSDCMILLIRKMSEIKSRPN